MAKDPKQTIHLQDIIQMEMHDPKHVALVITSPNTDETTRLGMATLDVSGLIFTLMRLNAAAVERQGKLPDGPNFGDVPRLQLEGIEVTHTVDRTEIGLVLHCAGKVRIPLTFPPETALEMADSIRKHALGGDAEPRH